MVAVDKLIPLAAARLKYLAKIREVVIDDFIFQLHYRVAMILLLGCSVLVTCTQFFGDPIKCIKGGDVPEKMLNTYCWVEGTFTLPKALTKAIDTEVVAPGVEQFYDKKDEVIKHAYYQWVSIVLFLQGLCFYITRKLWKSWENGKMKNLMMDLNKVILTEKKKKESGDTLVEYLHSNRGAHNAYAFRYFICEVLNFLHIVLQLVFINWFLGGEFSSYGLDVIKYVDMDQDKRPDPIVKVFPKLTKCTFRRFGPSGDLMQFDNLCLLPLNILNEKIYIITWFWLYILAIVSGVMICYRIAIIAFPRTRYFLLQRLHHLVPPANLDIILNRCGYGDWFLLYLLGKNLDPMHYRDVVIQLSEKLDKLPAMNDEVDGTKNESRV